MKFCCDILFRVLRFGDRRRLTKLEGVGRQFHHLVEKWFVKMPFLRLNIQLQPGFAFFVRHKLKFIINDVIFSEVLEARIGRKEDRKEVSLADLAEFPPFLRFNQVVLRYDTGSQSPLAKCRLFDECLNSIKPALKDSNEIRFFAIIDHDDPNHFSDYSSVVFYLCYGLLPILNSSRRYNFVIDLDPDKNFATALISSILEISQVRSCPTVKIELFFDNMMLMTSTHLPVEDISNWLAAKTDDGVEIYGKKQENRFLLIYSDIIPNTQEMWEHLKEVNYFGFRFRFCSFLFAIIAFQNFMVPLIFSSKLYFFSFL